MQKKSPILWLLLFLSLAACASPGNPSPPAPTPTPSAIQAVPTTDPDNTVRFAYRNVSFVTPPFLSNKITAERLELREQRDPADDVPSFIQINIRDPWDVIDENGLYSQVLVYPLADLVQTYPEASDGAVKLLDIIQQSAEPLPEQLPFWPLEYFSGVVGAPLKSLGQPVLFAHAQRMDFGSGHGVRYLTLLVQQPSRPYPLQGLIYTYQGLTDDGQYYVSVVLPILIRGEALERNLEQLAEPSTPDYAALAASLNGLGPDQFQSTLGEFDGMIKSLVISP